MRLLLVSILCLAPITAQSALKQSLSFHASFDGSGDADVAKGDKRIYTAKDFKSTDAATPGVTAPGASIERAGGKFGGALAFAQQNQAAVFFRALANAPVAERNWTGTVSFWLAIDPESDVKQYCDPLQLTDSGYNDSAVWVDFAKEGGPAKFRLGVFGENIAWNPDRVKEDFKLPHFNNRLVISPKVPFARSRWTHVAAAFERLGTPGGRAQLFVDGEAMGEAKNISEKFDWDVKNVSFRLAVGCAGKLDDLAFFTKALSPAEVKQVFGLTGGVASLRR